MAYYRCMMSGGSGDFPVTLTVTCNSAFVGETLYLTKGLIVLSKTVPATGIVEFEFPENGTWVLSNSLTSDTETFENVGEYETNLYSVPDGKTVLPTDDIQTWLACAGITNKIYTTLAEVLADSTTLSALIASNNAVDYMVRSTTWAVPITVPIMTSDTTPSGVVSVSTFYDSNSRGYKAFDGNDSTRWESANVSPFVNVWIQYQFANPITVAKIKMLLPQRNQPATFQLQGSNDGENFTTVQSYTNDSASQTTKEYTNSDTAEYSYWRLLVTSIHKSSASSSYWTGFNTLQFYSASITDNSTAMSYIGLNNYCANTLLADSTWCEAICNSEYFESVLNVKVPVMTSNTTPSGVVSASSNYTNTAPWKAFDGDNNTEWDPSSNASPSWLMYEFPTNTRIYLAWMRIREKKSGFTAYIQGSNDGLTWETLYTHPADTSSGGAYYEEWAVLSSVSDYKYYRWYTTRVAFIAGNFSANPRQMQFYGREDV